MPYESQSVCYLSILANFMDYLYLIKNPVDKKGNLQTPFFNIDSSAPKAQLGMRSLIT